MQDLFGGKPANVTARQRSSASEDKCANVKLRWESQDDSDDAAVEALVSADAQGFLVATPQAAVNLVRGIKNSSCYVRMTTQIAKLDGRVVGYVQLAQVRVGARTHLMLIGSACAKDAPSGLRKKLLGNVLQTARAGFYTAVLTVLGEGSLPGVAVKPAAEFGIESPRQIPQERLFAAELIACGLEGPSGTLVLDGPLVEVSAETLPQMRALGD